LRIGLSRGEEVFEGFIGLADAQVAVGNLDLQFDELRVGLKNGEVEREGGFEAILHFATIRLGVESLGESFCLA
jgi:hypothetical protein